MIEELTNKNLMEIRENVQRVVGSLEVCWRCQNVSECQKHILGNLVLVWLCGGCVSQMETPQVSKRRKKIRVPV